MYFSVSPCLCGEKVFPIKSFRKELWFNVPSRRGFINITPQIDDDERGLLGDLEVWLEKLAPHEPVSQYRHNSGEDNADAHLKRSIMGREVVVAITNGKLDFGPWEQIFYGEFDGRRKKRVLVKIIGE
jgi:secondary thiamine-phosphate synthase enzyme